MSRQQRVIIVAFGSHGDVLPFIALGSALRRRTHAVVLAAPPAFARLAAAVDVPFRPLGAHEDYEAINADARLWDAKAGTRIMFDLAIRLAEVGDALVEAEASDARAHVQRFVAVGSTLSFGPRFAQERLGIRAVSAHLSPFLIRSRTAPPTLPGLNLPPWLPSALTHATQRLADRFGADPARLPPLNAVRNALGLPAIARLTDWIHSPDGVLLMAPSWFAPPQPDWPSQLVQTGFPRGDRVGDATELSEALSAFLDSGAPPVAITYGSSMRHGRDLFEIAVQACARLGRRAVLVTGRPEQLPDSLPSGILPVAYAPFSRLLPRCAGLVHHGGIGTLSEALAAGVPQLIVPNAFDQFDNAARVARLGVGARIDRSRLTLDRMAAALDHLIGSKAVATACADAQLRMSREDGLASACDAIERVAAAL